MSETYYVVRYEGPFGFIKPWTAVRDGDTYSQQFLTPSIVEGMRQKLEVSAILRHRLQHRGVSVQQEQTQPADWTISRGVARRPRSIINRGVMLRPRLYLAFPTMPDAEAAAIQHLCLCRAEDLVYPAGSIETMTPDEFGAIPGAELEFGEEPDAFPVGFSRYGERLMTYGTLRVVDGEPDE